MTYQSGRSRRLLIAYILRDIRGVARSSMQDLLRLILPCFGFSNFLLLLNHDLARPCCVSLVLTTEHAEQFAWLITVPSSAKASSPSAS
jgi:predicted permease